MIDSAFIEYKEQVREGLDFRAYFEQAYGVRVNGAKTPRVFCPRHEDVNTPSMVLYEDHAHCFTCKAHLDVFDALMDLHKCTFLEAVYIGGDALGLQRLNATPEQRQAAQERRSAQDILRLAARFYVDQLWSDKGRQALEYARSRGWTDETIRAAGLGYAANDNALAVHLGEQSVDLALAHKIGLLRGDRYDFCNGRGPDDQAGYETSPDGFLVYPHVRAGRVEYLAARATTPDVKAHRNLPGTKWPFFNSAYSPRSKIVILVESQADAITLAQWGMPAVALCGSSASGPHWTQIAKRQTVYVIPDGDGKTKLDKLADTIGPLMRVARLPAGVGDLNAWAIAEAQSDDLAGLLDAAQTWLDLKVHEHQYAQGLARDQALREVFDLLAQIDDPFVLMRLRSDLPRRLGLGARQYDSLLKARTTNDSTKPPSIDDYLRALSSLGYSFSMNVCNNQILVNDAQLSDVLAAKIRAQMRELGYSEPACFEDAYIARALDRSFHPVKDYLDALHWDGCDAIAALAGKFAYDRGDLPAFLRRWLIGAVAKVYQAEQNRMLILDGAQDIGKSHFVRWLCSPLPDMLVEAPINPESKDDYLRLITCWVWEVAELGSTTRKADREALKHFLTMRQVTVRPPYGRHDLIKPAMASFIGTVNNEAGVLSDPTGNRRFMVCHLLAIDWSYTDLDVDQVWAQAVHLYREGEPWTLQGDELATAAAVNAEYEVEDPLEGYIERCFELTFRVEDFLPTCDIIDRLHTAGWRLRTPRTESMAIGTVLRKKGLDKDRIGDLRGWLGVKAKALAQDPPPY